LIRVYTIPYSTNVERVALALAHKGIPAEQRIADPADRSEVRAVSGQPLVPVLVDGETILPDSPAILAYLERRYPSSPLYPSDTARRAEMDVFVDWFNRVWKGPPNEIDFELRGQAPDHDRISGLARSMAESLDLFEAMLGGRDYLMDDVFTAADVVAFPFLKYALLSPASDDPDTFHQVLCDYQQLDGHRRLEAWIRRIDERPRAWQA
jgi:glutathione S-transferase